MKQDDREKARREVSYNNKSDRPSNIIENERDIFLRCEEIEQEFPRWFRSYCIYLKGNLLPMSRLVYLQDVRAFLLYLIHDTGLIEADTVKEITKEELASVQARDVNDYINYCRNYTAEENGRTVLYENTNKTLARKKSALSVFFKELYREGILSKNITDAFDPIRIPKPGEREIKALRDDEVMVMLDAVTTGSGLTPHERSYWEKTKYRDKCILVMFLTYGLRLQELQQLNLSSINFSRGEFKIYRKRGKEAIMPLNRSVEMVLNDYLKNERDHIRIREGEEDALFLSLQGRRMTQRAIRELVKKYTSIPLHTTRRGGYSPHKLRATAATSLIGRGNSIYDVQALLDHEQVTTTQLYASHKMNVKRDLVKNMEWELERKDQE